MPSIAALKNEQSKYKFLSALKLYNSNEKPNHKFRKKFKKLKYLAVQSLKTEITEGCIH